MGHADRFRYPVLGAPKSGNAALWRAPFDRELADAHIEWPRIGYLDFQRWVANPRLRAAFYHGLATNDIEEFEVLLMAAYIGRTDDVELAEMLERLPDPAVNGMRLELFETDNLCADPAASATPDELLPVAHRIDAPRLAEILKGEVLNAIGKRQIKVVLRAIHTAFRHSLRLRSLGQETPGKLAIDKRQGYTEVSVPAGVVARLLVRPQVALALFATHEDAPPAFDKRLLQWATAFDSDQQFASFEGASLQIETMIGPLASKESSGWRLNRAGWVKQVQDGRVRHEGAGIARQYRMCTVPVAEGWHWRQLASVDTATQRWRFSGRPIYTWFSPKELARDKVKAKGCASIELAPDPSYQAFEEEAFLGRDPLDAEIETVTLLPLPAPTTLANVAWDRASATLFRHRFTVRSRYAGARPPLLNGCSWSTAIVGGVAFVAWSGDDVSGRRARNCGRVSVRCERSASMAILHQACI